MSFHPYKNESDALSIGRLSIENRLDRVSFFGGLDLTKDQIGLRHALALKAVLDDIVKELSSELTLPDAVQAPDQPTKGRNPFE